MELTPSHLQSEHLDSDPLFQFDGATLWYINSIHPDVVPTTTSAPDSPPL
jgi:hypothetical protein